LITREQFTQGLLIFNSCGGPNADGATLTVWYELLKNIEPFFYREAIIDLVKNDLNLGCCNFVGEIIKRAKIAESEWMSRAAPFVLVIETKMECQKIIENKDSDGAFDLLIENMPIGSIGNLQEFEEFVPKELQKEFYVLAWRECRRVLQEYRDRFKIAPAEYYKASEHIDRVVENIKKLKVVA